MFGRRYVRRTVSGCGGIMGNATVVASALLAMLIVITRRWNVTDLWLDRWVSRFDVRLDSATSRDVLRRYLVRGRRVRHCVFVAGVGLSSLPLTAGVGVASTSNRLPSLLVEYAWVIVAAAGCGLAQYHQPQPLTAGDSLAAHMSSSYGQNVRTRWARAAMRLLPVILSGAVVAALIVTVGGHSQPVLAWTGVLIVSYAFLLMRYGWSPSVELFDRPESEQIEGTLRAVSAYNGLHTVAASLGVAVVGLGAALSPLGGRWPAIVMVAGVATAVAFWRLLV